jgi:GT2 family glycosyltransferase
LLINQTDSLVESIEFSSDLVHVKQIMSDRISLSAARNVGIKYIFENKIKGKYVLFPDDDSTFDVHFFSRYNRLVDEKNSNFLIDVFAENTNELYIKNCLSDGELIKDNKDQVAMSVNMLISIDTIEKVGFFDEKMGVGAMYGAGEDTDYFLRCVSSSGPFVYNKSLWNFHPKFESKHESLTIKELISKYKNYGRGVIYLYVKHRLYISAIKSCFNALLGSFLAFLKLDFNLALARFYAFFIRVYTFGMLILGVYK